MGDAIKARESQQCVCNLRGNWRRNRGKSRRQYRIIKRKIGFVLDACATRTAIVVCGALLSINEAQLEQIKLRLLAA